MTTGLPKNLIAGTQVTWYERFSSYPSDVWAAQYVIKGGAGAVTVNGVAEGDGFRFTLTPTQSATLVTGTNWFQGFVTQGSVKYTIAQGTFNVLVNLATATGSIDLRSTYKRVIDLIDAKLSGRITSGESQYTIGDRQISMMSLKELTEARAVYVSLLNTEVRKGRTGSIFGTIKTRFTNTD